MLQIWFYKIHKSTIKFHILYCFYIWYQMISISESYLKLGFTFKQSKWKLDSTLSESSENEVPQSKSDRLSCRECAWNLLLKKWKRSLKIDLQLSSTFIDSFDIIFLKQTVNALHPKRGTKVYFKLDGFHIQRTNVKVRFHIQYIEPKPRN